MSWAESQGTVTLLLYIKTLIQMLFSQHHMHSAQFVIFLQISLFFSFATMEKLCIAEEGEGATIHFASNPNTVVSFENCLIGRFLNDKLVRTHVMKERLASIWRPGRGVTIIPLEDNRYIFQFYHPLDAERVFKGGPWSFDTCMLVLKKAEPGDNPQTVTLNSIDLWVQIYNLPFGFMSDIVGEMFGNYIGTFVEYDSNNNWGPWRKFMRIRVAIDVTKPLKKSWTIREAGGDWFTATFKYERLGLFCFMCGVMGHTELFCEKRFDAGADELELNWGNFIKADLGVGSGGGATNRWLRDGRVAAAGVNNFGTNSHQGNNNQTSSNFSNDSHAAKNPIVERM